MRPPSRHGAWLPTALLLALVAAGCAATPTSPVPSPTIGPSSAPGATATPTATATPSPSASSPEPTTSPSPAFMVYAVAPGDTLSAIARRYDTTWQSLVFWNLDRYPSLDPADPKYDPDRLEVGWELRFVPGLVIDYQPSPAPTSSPSASAGGSSVPSSTATAPAAPSP